jgi:tetrapyrrole methylase family protein / MazG family protein
MTRRKKSKRAPKRNRKVVSKAPARKLSTKKPSPRKETPGHSFEKLFGVMARLRAPGGCPWDREQTHATLRTYLIEEAYEVLDALDACDDSKFAEELGDLLLQVLFHAQIAAEQKRFDIVDVITEIYEKMIRRHPHVFGDKSAKDSAEVLRNWEIIKAEERRKKGIAQPGAAPSEKSADAGENDPPESLLHGVPRSLPALLQGFQLTRKAARAGFDWHNIDGIFDKLQEETEELRGALKHGETSDIEGELGDIFFVVVNLARFLKIDPEIALNQSNAKFARRFREMERIARLKGTTFAKVPRPEMEALWEAAKRNLHAAPKGN